MGGSRERVTDWCKSLYYNSFLWWPNRNVTDGTRMPANCVRTAIKRYHCGCIPPSPTSCWHLDLDVLDLVHLLYNVHYTSYILVCCECREESSQLPSFSNE